MRFLLWTLSLSYLRNHLAKMLLTVLGVAVGVATVVSIRSAQTALLHGLRNTVDRIAGRAQLEVVGDVGVPEDLLEQVRKVVGVRAVAPIIEQVVRVEGAEAGSLLVLGVDLLGDSQMRDYTMEGSQDIADDPLLFLVQPDSIAVSTSFARQAGIDMDDPLLLRIANGTKRVRVRGLFEAKGFAEAFAGRVAVCDVSAAQALFGRGPRFDRIEVRLEDGIPLEEASRHLTEAVGPGLRVETPERRGAQMERLISNFMIGFDVTCTVALGVGVFLIFNTFMVSVNRRRRDVGVLRALGATPRQVQALFLLEAGFLGVTGGLLGLLAGVGLAGSSFRVMHDTVQSVFGLSAASVIRVDDQLVVLALGLGILASLVGAWVPARAAAGVRPVEAFAKASFTVREDPSSGLRLAAGGATLLGAILLAVLQPIPTTLLIVSVILLGYLGTSLLAGPAAHACLALFTPVIGRLSPVSGRLAVDSLLGNPRRTAGTVTAVMFSLAAVLGMDGYIHSYRLAFDRWMDNILTSDIFVRSSTKYLRPDFRFPPDVRTELLRIPGIATVESYRKESVAYRGEQVAIDSIEIEDTLKRTSYEFSQGDAQSFLRGLAHEGKCAVSENFSFRHHLGVGDVLVLTSPAGTARLPIAAVFIDYTSERGTILMDRQLFVALWKDDRVDTFDVNLEPGADMRQVRQSIQTAIGSRFPALIMSRQEFTTEIRGALDSFFRLSQTTLLTALVVAFIGIVTSLMISVMERTREIGILKALGGLNRQIGLGVLCEALAVSLAGLLLAVPTGFLLATFNQTTVSETLVGWSLPSHLPWASLLLMFLYLPLISVLASWIPARQALRIKVLEAISCE